MKDVVAHSIIALTGSNFAIRRAAFESVHGFSEQYLMFNDADFLARCLLAGLQGATVPEFTVIWRQHPSAQLTDRSVQRALSYRQLFEEYGHFLNPNQLRLQRRHYFRMREQLSHGGARWWWAVRKLLLIRIPDIQSSIGQRLRNRAVGQDSK